MTDPRQGDIWRYDYLWRWQSDEGETEGRKNRPCAFIAVVKAADGKTNLFILPITSKEPGKDRGVLEIPEMERRRAGLATDRRLWLLLDEYNHDVLETSFYFDPNERLGSLGAAFLRKALAAFAETVKTRRARRVTRIDHPDT